ncbi:transcriptional regulator [Mycobacterium paraense]|uniref:Transcriptional regulator n=2 Tax=Mycobacterium paraense TaxID=767916 RepID=A0ABX3VGM6_9MYCO|nr:helix-turn-helix domain-containing protein [Mycobacterium paraense]ORW27572.1 transcriptional regulator [Mycobacterium paraense]ORW39633.1 transcriptional regulator [Mycobacterium paraense]
MSTNEVSALTGIKQSTLRYWRHCDEGPPSFAMGGRVMYRRTAVMAWIEQQEQATRRDGHPIASQS